MICTVDLAGSEKRLALSQWDWLARSPELDHWNYKFILSKKTIDL